MNAPWPVFAFNNYFQRAPRPYSLEAQWDLLKSLGYDKGYLSVTAQSQDSWADFHGLSAQRDRTGLGLAAVYTIVDLSASPPAGCPTPREILNHLRPGDTLELAIHCGWQRDCSSPQHDAAGEAYLAPLLKLADTRGITISLYHHYGFWIERIEDCVRLAPRMNHPRLRVTFCGYHWYACDRTDLPGKIALAKPWLHLANLCGARPAVDFAGALPATIEPVGEGDFPHVEFLRILREAGYVGDIGFQGFGLEGDPEITLKKSLDAFRAASESLNEA